jgi:hypothetical protein
MNTQVSVGAVISRTLDIYGKRFGLLIAMAAVLFIPAGIVRAIVDQAGLLGSVLGSVIQIVAITVYSGAVVRVVQAENSGAELGSLGEIFSSVKDRIWPLFWVGLVSGIAIGFGIILLLVPGLILMTIWAVFQPAIVVEHISFGSLGRSRQLVKGKGWSVFGIIVVVFILQAVVAALTSVIGLAIGGVIGLFIAAVILSVFLLPIEGLVHSVLYFSLAGQVAEAGADSGQAPPPPPAVQPAV